MTIQKTGLKSKALPSNLVGLSTEYEKGKRWDKLKTANKEIGNTYKTIATPSTLKLANRVADCSNFLEFETDEKRTAWRLSKASFCHVRLCPVCQWRKSLVWQKRFLTALPKLQESQPKARYIFLTLTVKNCEVKDTRQTLQHLQQSLKRLTLLKAWPAIGWLRTFEITKGKNDTSHPHIHALLMVKPSYFQGSQYLSQAKWSELWQECLRVDYLPQVNVQVVKPKEGTALDPIASALLEVFKYSVKPSDLYDNPAFLDELTRQLKGVRAVGLGGLFKDFIKDDPAQVEELEGVEVVDPLKLFYNYYPDFKQYARHA